MAAMMPRALLSLALWSSAVGLAGCGGTAEPAPQPHDCAALPESWPLYSLVEDPHAMGETLTSIADGTALRLDIAGLQFKRSGEREGGAAHYRIDIRLPDHCALESLTGTIEGRAETLDTEARLLVELDGETLIHDWDRGSHETFALETTRDYQPGQIEPEPAPAGIVRPGERAYRVGLSLEPRFYGGTDEATIAIERVRLAAVLAEGSD